jgi:hypothetical protein
MHELRDGHVSLLQRFGVETDTFSTGKGTLAGLEIAG